MKKILTLMAVMVMGSTCGDVKSATLTVVAIEHGAISVEVHNATSENIVVLSPDAPSRQVDAERCLLILTTKVTDDLRPYAFTPVLRPVEAGSARRFRAVLTPVAPAPKPCREWTITAEYAYVGQVAAITFNGRPSEDFRQYVLANQKIMRASATMPIDN
jgi:hypothetical protein